MLRSLQAVMAVVLCSVLMAAMSEDGMAQSMGRECLVCLGQNQHCAALVQCERNCKRRGAFRDCRRGCRAERQACKKQCKTVAGGDREVCEASCQAASDACKSDCKSHQVSCRSNCSSSKAAEVCEDTCGPCWSLLTR